MLDTKIKYEEETWIEQCPGCRINKQDRTEAEIADSMLFRVQVHKVTEYL
ncbi:hypothetical protein [Endozoicomonas numazuensis]|nr:hypothetical protein [Endozoicomonas numazuensis]